MPELESGPCLSMPIMPCQNSRDNEHTGRGTRQNTSSRWTGGKWYEALGFGQAATTSLHLARRRFGRSSNGSRSQCSFMEHFLTPRVEVCCWDGSYDKFVQYDALLHPEQDASHILSCAMNGDHRYISSLTYRQAQRAYAYMI